jgi:hypothetical protein
MAEKEREKHSFVLPQTTNKTNQNNIHYMIIEKAQGIAQRKIIQKFHSRYISDGVAVRSHIHLRHPRFTKIIYL